MTSHADRIREIADAAYHAHRNRQGPNFQQTQDALHAGADALDTLIKVRKVAELLDQMAEDNRATATQLDWAAPGAIGREHAYTKAAQFIREALGDTP